MIKVLIDTREKTPWSFTYDDIIDSSCIKLSTGDYTIEGMETLFCIERKQSVAELAHNLCEKRFERELERLQPYKYKFLIGEFGWCDILRYPDGANMPYKLRQQVKITGKFITAKLLTFQLKYGFNFIAAGDRECAIKVATSLIKRVYESERKTSNST